MDAPTRKDIETLTADLGLSIPDEEIDAYRQLLADRLDPLREIANHDDLTPAGGGDRDGNQPTPEEDPLNAWITTCDIQRTSQGPLAGYTVGLKDNISVAGIPLTNGSAVFEGYVPPHDATIVQRLLNAGACILGKNNMWSFSMGQSDFGPVENPTSQTYGIGGSSSGTAAAVAAGEIDIGIGGDQGGSIRMPSSFAGLVGLKPTHGLVPYTGILGADPTIDHTGPITRTVADAARTLAVIAGRDDLDARQGYDLSVGEYENALDADPDTMRVGVLHEGFDHPDSDPDVLGRVRQVVDALEETGVDTVDVSVPEHEMAGDLTLAVVRYGYGQLLRLGALVGTSGWQDVSAIEHVTDALQSQSSSLPIPAKSNLLLAEFVRRETGGSPYARAQNQARKVRAAYDQVLEEVDALLMSTVPIMPPEAGSDRDLESLLEQEGEPLIARNTLPFNISHHPAMTVPAGTVDGAPIGAMLVGKRFGEDALFSLGAIVEQFDSFGE